MNNKTLNYLTLLLVGIAFPLLIIQYFVEHSNVGILTYIGLAIMTPSFILLIIARLQLGASFQISAAANKLVTTGLYKKFRHPIYYFSLLLISGYGIFVHQPLVGVFCIAIIVVQLKRIKNEEKVLEEKFGEEYLTYKKTTWF